MCKDVKDRQNQDFLETRNSIVFNPTEASLPKLLVSLFDSDTDSQDLAFASVMFNKVNAIKPYFEYLCYIELIESKLEQGDLRVAAWAYSQIVKLGLYIDTRLAERLIASAAYSCDIKSLKDIFSFYRPLTNNMLKSIAEPLILSGYTKTYANCLGGYLKSNPLPSSFHVSEVVTYILKARIRRSLANYPCSIAEMTGIKQIEELLQSYLEDISDEYDRGFQIVEPIVDYLDLSKDWFINDLPAAFIALPYSSRRFDLKRDRVNPSFPYLSEHRFDLSTRKIKDWTSQLSHSRRAILPLYNADLFPQEMIVEELFTNKALERALYVDDFDPTEQLLQAASVDFADDEDDEDDDSDDYSIKSNPTDSDDDDSDADDSDDEELKELVDEFFIPPPDGHSLGGMGDDFPEIHLTIDSQPFNVEFQEELIRIAHADKPKTNDFNDISNSLLNAFPNDKIEYAEDIFDGVSDDSFVQDSVSKQE